MEDAYLLIHMRHLYLIFVNINRVYTSLYNTDASVKVHVFCFEKHPCFNSFHYV